MTGGARRSMHAMAPLDEAKLARAAAAGDGQAFARLYDEYEGRIFNFCLRIVGGQEDAADATQDAFLKVLQRLPKFPADQELNFGAYLFTAARNASYDVIGKRKKADPVDLIPESGARPLDGDERGRMDLDPERAALLGALQLQVQAANERLPERQREVLALREVEELSYDEIAEIMDMNRNSVAQLISRARIKLRDELQGSALASIATSSPACERALPLLSLRQDGQLRDNDDRGWLEDHVADCETCKVSVEAMAEAGMSYRAWAPILPVAWLWKSTAAKAAELTSSDWQAVIDRQRDLHSGSPSSGSSSSSSGAGSSPGAAGGSGVGTAAGVGAGAVVEGAVGASSSAAAGASRPVRAAGTAAHHRRRRRGAVAGTMLLAIILALLLVGRDEVPATLDAGLVDRSQFAPATTPTTATTATTPPAATTAAPAPGPAKTPAGPKTRTPAKSKASSPAPAVIGPAASVPVVPVVFPTPAPAPAPPRAPARPPARTTPPKPVRTSTPKPAPARPTIGGIDRTGNTGSAPAGTTSPPVTPPPPADPAPAPPATPQPTNDPTPGASYCDQNPQDARCRPCGPGATVCRRSAPDVPPAMPAAAPAPSRLSGAAGSAAG